MKLVSETSNNYRSKKHIESVHEGTKAFKCNICTYETARKPSLKRHIKSIYSSAVFVHMKLFEFL